MPQGDAGAGLLSLAQQREVQGGGVLLGHQHQRFHTVGLQGLHILDGGAEGSHLGGHIQRQHAVLLAGGVQQLLAQQTFDGVARLGLCGAGQLIAGDQHNVALNGVALRGTVAAVAGVFFAHGNVTAVQCDVALHHLLLRGQIALHTGRIHLGGKGTHAQHGSGAHRHSGTAQGTDKLFVQHLHRKYLLKTAAAGTALFFLHHNFFKPWFSCGAFTMENRRICFVNGYGGRIIAKDSKIFIFRDFLVYFRHHRG